MLKLYKELGITSLAELEAAARADRLKGVKGLGPPCRPRFCRTSKSAAAAKAGVHMHRAALLLENAERSLRQAHPELTAHNPGRGFPARLRTGLPTSHWSRKRPRWKMDRLTLTPGEALHVHPD